MWGVSEDVPVICAVAQQLHAKRKGMDILLQAVLRIREPVQLLLAGENRDLVIPPNVSVRIVEPIQDPRLLRAFYAAADVVAVPSREDNLPNVMLEALACGVPVVGSRIGGIPDAVRPEETGWLADSEDIESWVVGLESALKAVRDNPVSWRGRTRSVAEREYSLATQAERYRSLFEVVATS
ncbi:MAG: glycosyltransferase [Kiritimatiellae bacterium]|nr:glycosyltransferase [Kiritimatiellia bacterium]